MTDFPNGWGGDPPPLTAAVIKRLLALPRMTLSFVAYEEVGLFHQGEGQLAGVNGVPTPLIGRRILGPWPDPTGHYTPLLLTIRPTRRDAEVAGAARVMSEGQCVHRFIAELEATSLPVVDTRTAFPSLTNSALLDKDPKAWRIVRAIRDRGDVQAIWIANAKGAEEVIVLFTDSIDDTVHIRDEAVFEIDGRANARRLTPAPVPPEPARDPRGGGWRAHARKSVVHLAIALLAAVIAHPAIKGFEALTGVKLTVPAAAVTMVGLAVGFGLARLIAPTVRACLGRGVRALGIVDGSGPDSARRTQKEKFPLGSGRSSGATSRLRRRVRISCFIGAGLYVFDVGLGWAGTGSGVTTPTGGVAMLTLGIGLLLVPPLARQLRVWRRLLAHLFELPDSQELMLKRLEELERESRRHRE